MTIFEELCSDIDSSWNTNANKAQTHGYNKTMNKPRFKEVCPNCDLGFSDSAKHAADEANIFVSDIEGVIDSINDGF